jgi:transcriptional regulator with XRE-family HTH domain
LPGLRKFSDGRGTGVVHPIDAHVGRRIRMRRMPLGMTQEVLQNALGLTFQQVQKYETGANRVSASRLATVAGVLGVSIAFFFAGLPEARSGRSDPDAEWLKRIEQLETIDLIRLYYAIPDDQIRRRFLDLVKAAAERQSLRSEAT